MFSKRVRIQLAVFGVLTVASMFVIAKDYVRAQDMVGIGQREVIVDFDDATGLYSGALVTYRGVKVGKVDGLELGAGANATVRVNLDTEFDIPANTVAIARSSSAIGENYIDLVPGDNKAPYLRNGSVIKTTQSYDLQPTGELLENLNAVAAAVPKEATDTLLREVTKAFDGSNQDFAQLISSANTLVSGANTNIKSITSLFNGLPPFLETATEVAPEATASVADLAAFTGSLERSEDDVNALLQTTPSLATAVQGLVSDIQSDVPVLLADLLSTGQVLKVYLPGIEQILVVYPGVMSAIQAASTGTAAPGSIKLGARLSVNQPPNCYKGFLPYKDQRDFHDETRRADVPDNLYCQEPANSPRAVRGARNTPCFNNPGVRAASVEECLGHKIGANIDPLGRKRVAATYDADNGRVLAPNGQYFDIGGVGSQAAKDQTWQSLLVK